MDEIDGESGQGSTIAYRNIETFSLGKFISKHSLEEKRRCWSDAGLRRLLALRRLGLADNGTRRSPLSLSLAIAARTDQSCLLPSWALILHRYIGGATFIRAGGYGCPDFLCSFFWKVLYGQHGRRGAGLATGRYQFQSLLSL